MGNRGRKSAASLSILAPLGAGASRRPDPPQDLTEEQAGEWKAVVNRMPADWFPRETHGVLAHYCRHVVTARYIGELIAAMESGSDGSTGLDLEKYERLLRLQEKEGRAISSLATRMRLTQHSRYDRKKGTGNVTRRPWEQ
jgi:hypothetical protein